MVSCGSIWAVASKAVLDGAPATVVYGGDDGGFTVLEQDRPPEQTDAPICVDCLLGLQPGLGRGLDVAKQHGVAYRGIDGEWKEKNVEVLQAYPASKDGGMP
jgi:hypothetical protein